MARLPKSIIKKYGITKKAWAVFRGRSGSTSSRKARHHSSGGKTKLSRRRRYYGRVRRYARRHGFGLNLPTIGKFLKAGALVLPGIAEYQSMSGPTERKLARTFAGYGGYNLDGQNFDWDLLAKMWTPYVATTLVIAGVQKISGIVKRI